MRGGHHPHQESQPPGWGSLGFGVSRWESPGLAIRRPGKTKLCCHLSVCPWAGPSHAGGLQILISHNDTLCFIAVSSGHFLTFLVLRASQHLVK